MQINAPEFQQIASNLRNLDKFEELFDSSAQLMADTLIGNGTVHCVGCDVTMPIALQLSRLLGYSPDESRPPLPALASEANNIGLNLFQAVVSEGDFSIFFGMSSSAAKIEPWLDTCLEKDITSLLVNPDLESIQPTDKALEIRLEYASFPDYLTSLAAVSNYLTKSIEVQLFGR